VQRAVAPAVAITSTGSLTVTAQVATACGSAGNANAASEDDATAVEGMTIRQPEVDQVARQASRGGLARLNANQRIIAAAALIAAVFSLLPDGLRERLLDDVNLVAAIANVLELMKG
jgi:hypothetical protein